MDSLDAVIARLGRVDWQTQTGCTVSRVALMREFLRRSALYAEAYGGVERWPFFDIAASVAPDAPDVPLPAQLEALVLPGRVLQSIRWMLKWAASPQARAHNLPDPYEPLLMFFERGGGFAVEQRMVDVGAAGIPIGDWQRYVRAEPFVVLERAALDALDGQKPPAEHEAWRALVAEPEGSAGNYEVTLSLARRFAREPPPGNRSVLLAGVPEALAARVALAGPQVAERFCADAGPLIASVAAQLGGTPRSSEGRAAFNLLTLQRVAEACGVVLPLPRFKPSAWTPALLVPELVSDEERLLLVLWTIDAGGRDKARALLRTLPIPPTQGGARAGLGPWVAELVATLSLAQPGDALQALWRDLLHVFPAWLPQGRAAWRHLLLAARCVFPRTRGTPPAQVAAALHREVLALGAPPSGAA